MTSKCFYDICRRLRYEIIFPGRDGLFNDCYGAVSENIYNVFGEIIATRKYALTSEALRSISVGYLKPASKKYLMICLVIKIVLYN